MPRSQDAYFIVQEGGSSSERYLHTFNRLRDAERHRRSCAMAAYRTSEVMVAPKQILDALSALDGPDLWDTIHALANASDEVDYP